MTLKMVPIETEEQLADYKRKLAQMEFECIGIQEEIRTFRKAIADYEAKHVAMQLSREAIILLECNCLSHSEFTNANRELIKFGIGGVGNSAARSTLAELQKSQISR